MRLGDYEVVREIGRGGMGIVFEVRARDGRRLALKLVPTPDPETRERALRERKIAATLGEQEGFVPLLDAGELETGLTFVMPLVEGGTLAARLARGPLPAEEALALARSLARALARAHALGIVHRDLKPANVLFTAKGEPLIADLGLAKVLPRDGSASGSTGITRTGAFAGTLGYAPPEQLDDARRATPASDVFSLGATIYECFTGTRPFGEGGLLETAERMREGRVAPLHRLVPGAPGWLGAVLARALDPHPKKRFADAAALARALEGTHERARLRLALAGFAALVTLASVALAFVPGRRPPPATSPTDPSAQRRLAEDSLREAKNALARKDAAAAVAAATSALAFDPSLHEATKVHAQALDECHRGVEARAELDAFITKCPDDPDGWVGRGRVRLRAGDRAGVIEDASRAIALDSRSREARRLRAVALLESRRPEAALEDARRLVEIEPQSSYNHQLLGQILEVQGTFDEALHEYGESISAGPDRADPRWHRAFLRARTGDRKGAFEDADAAVAAQPADAVGFANRGRLRLQQGGDLQAALDDTERALALKPDLDLAFSLRSRVLLELDGHRPGPRTREALDSASKAVELAPGNPLYRFERGALLADTGRATEALADFDRAIEMDPRNTHFRSQRARLRFDLHDERGAFEDTKAVLDLGDPEGFYFQAVMHHARGEGQLAIDEVSAFIEKSSGKPPPMIDSARRDRERWRAELRSKEPSRER